MLCILQCLQGLTNSPYQIVSPEFHFLYIKDYCILRNMLLTILKRASKTPVFDRPISVSNDKTHRAQRLSIKSMFSTTSCVCNLGSLKLYQFFFLNKWCYTLWLKIAITCLSNTRFTCKIIPALYI